MLALASGFRSALVSTGRHDNVIVLRKGADAEISSGITRESVAVIRSMPGIARLGDGRPMVTADVYVVVSKPRLDGSETHMPVRGVGPEAFAIRDAVRIVEGRAFEPGRAEVIVGRGLAGRMANTRIGDKLRFGQQDITSVGHSDADCLAYQHQAPGHVG